jgi:YVTN family beta-propeller protein
MDEVTFSQLLVPTAYSVGSVGLAAFFKWMLRKVGKCSCFKQITMETIGQGYGVIKEAGPAVMEHKEGCIERIKSFCSPSQWFELTYIVGRLEGSQQEGCVWVVDPRNEDGKWFLLQKSIKIGNSPVGMAVTSDHKKIYIVCQGNRAIYVISTWENKVVEIIEGLLCEYPEEIVITPDGRKAYVTYRTHTSITMVKTSQKCGRYLKFECMRQLEICTMICNCAYSTRVEHIDIGKTTKGIGMTPDGKYIYLANYACKTFTVVNVETDTVERTVQLVDHPEKFVIGPIPNNYLYVLNTQSVTRIHPSAWEVKTILRGSNPSSAS